jgi:transposase
VPARRLRHREVFVPLRRDPGHVQVDFGEALAEIAGVERKIHFFAMDLRTATSVSCRPIWAGTAEAFCDGHYVAFEFFGKVSRSILYDNAKLAVAPILGDGVRQRTGEFSERQSHYVFADRFGPLCLFLCRRNALAQLPPADLQVPVLGSTDAVSAR